MCGQAPEILLGEVYNERIDVFSFAMCLIELVVSTARHSAACL